jgi:hypothetical protein
MSLFEFQLFFVVELPMFLFLHIVLARFLA